MSKETSRLLADAASRLYDDSEELAKFAVEILEEVKDRTIATITKGAQSDGLNEPVSLFKQKQFLLDVDKHLTRANESLQRHFTGAWSNGYQLQFTGVINQVTLFEKTAPSGITDIHSKRIAALQPKLSGTLIKATMDSSLHKLSAAVSDLKDPIRRILAVNTLSGASYNQTIKEISATGINKGPFKTVEARAKTIAITETTNIYNAAHMESIVAVNRVLDEGEKIKLEWLALLDRKTCSICTSLHKQVRDQGKDFVASNGWRGKGPSAHPNCRCMVVPFKPQWQSIFDELDAALEAST